MESKGAPVINPETKRNVEIKHFQGIDVVLNPRSLSYDRESLLEIIEDESMTAKAKIEYPKLVSRIEDINDENGYKRFYVKTKRDSLQVQDSIDFLKGRTNIDFINDSGFSREARYARIGVLNEMILSKKIKELIKSQKFQELVRRYGFLNLDFPEPILAMVINRSNHKYLVYKNIRSPIAYPMPRPSNEMVKELKELFIDNGVMPYDLRLDQFMVTGDEKGTHLFLIDVESYTEKRDSND